jgi:flagellar hook-associated protein 1
MSISQSLSNALSGLTAASRMAEVVSSNLSNALTDGYGRRSVDLSSQTVGGRGAGVRIDGITRHVDRGILADRRLADADLAGQQSALTTLGRVETAIGAVGDPNGLSARLASLEQALTSIAGDPSSEVRQSNVVSRLSGVTQALQQSAGVIRGLRQDAEESITSQVKTLNVSLVQVETLNLDIMKARNAGGDASALMDQRQLVIDRISAIVPVRELARGNGAVAVMTASGQMLIDGPALQFGFTPANYVTPDMTMASGGLRGLTLDGMPLPGGSGYGRLEGGALGAAFALRDDTLVKAQSGLDAVARDLIDRFATPATDPTLAIGDAGLLTDAGAAFDPLDEVGLSARIAVNASVDPAQGGAAWRIRDGVNAVTAGQAGDGRQIDRWMDALSAPQPLGGSGPPRSAAGHIAALESAIGGQRLIAEEDLSFGTARWDILHQAELADGVDSDHELQMLMQIEQAYAANAKVMQTVQTMIQTLMEI